MPRGKPFICWLGRDHSVALHIGDAVQFQKSTDDSEWMTGTIGCKRSGAYVFRKGKKEYPVFFTFQLKAIETGAMKG